MMSPMPGVASESEAMGEQGTGSKGRNAVLVFLLAISVFPAFVVAVEEKPLPFIVLHGIGDECRNQGLYEFTNFLINESGAFGFCIEIGNGASDSFFMRLDKQADLVCEQVKKIPELRGGYNVVGLSQGNVVARAVIEFCDGGPPVHNFVSLGGPHAGTASIPGCSIMSLCKLADALIRLGVYSSFVQNHLAPSGYVKIPNEDAILVPPQTAWFGYYGENDFTTVLPPERTDLYKEDWIGLRTLDEAGRVTYIAFPGDHLSINDVQLKKFVVPYLRSSPIAPSIDWSSY